MLYEARLLWDDSLCVPTQSCQKYIPSSSITHYWPLIIILIPCLLVIFSLDVLHTLQCLKLLEVETSPFRARAWLTGYKGKFLGSSAVRGTYVCIDTTSPNEDTTSPGAKTTSFLDTASLRHWYSQVQACMQKFGELNFVKTGLKSKFEVNPQSFFHELRLYITRFSHSLLVTSSQDRLGHLAHALAHELWTFKRPYIFVSPHFGLRMQRFAIYRKQMTYRMHLMIYGMYKWFMQRRFIECIKCRRFSKIKRAKN